MGMLNLKIIIKKGKTTDQSRNVRRFRFDKYSVIQWLIQINLKYVNKRKEKKSYMGLDLCLLYKSFGQL